MGGLARAGVLLLIAAGILLLVASFFPLGWVEYNVVMRKNYFIEEPRLNNFAMIAALGCWLLAGVVVAWHLLETRTRR